MSYKLGVFSALITSQNSNINLLRNCINAKWQTHLIFINTNLPPYCFNYRLIVDTNITSHQTLKNQTSDILLYL